MLQRSVVDYGDESPRSCRSSDTLRQRSTGGTPVRSKPPRLSERQELQREHEEYLRDPRRERWLKDDSEDSWIKIRDDWWHSGLSQEER